MALGSTWGQHVAWTRLAVRWRTESHFSDDAMAVRYYWAPNPEPTQATTTADIHAKPIAIKGPCAGRDWMPSR